MRRWLRGHDRPGERDLAALLKGRQTLGGKRQSTELFGRLHYQAESCEFPANDFPFRPALLPADAIGREVLMIPFADVLSVRPREDLGDLVNAEIESALLADTVNAREEFLSGKSPVVSLTRGRAIIATPAVFKSVSFAKILQQLAAAAGTVLGIMNHLFQLGAGDLALFRIRFFVDKLALLDRIAGTEEENAITGQAIASGAAGFLVITFNILWQIVMHHKANIGFVNPHTEGDRRANDPDLVPQEKLLMAAA